MILIQPSSSRLEREASSLVGSSEIDDLLPTSVSGRVSCELVHQ